MPARLIIDETKTFTGSMSAVELLVEEATIKIDPEAGLSLSALEPAKTAMVQVVLPKPFFTEFEVDQERYVGINFTELIKVLKRAKSTEIVALIFDENSITVEIKGKYTRKFILPLLAGEPFKMRELKVDFKAGARIECKGFPSMIKDLELVGNEVEVEISTEAVKLKTSGRGTESVIEISREDPILLDLWADEPSKSIYSLAYLERMAKPAAIAQDMSIEISTNTPMRMRYSLGFEGANVTYYLVHLSV